MSSSHPAEVECNIRALTTAIRLLEPGWPDTSATPIPARQSGSGSRALGRVYNHIATLLTQDYSGLHVVAVSGRFTSAGLFVNALETEETSAIDSTSSTHYGPASKNLLNLEEIRPSKTPLRDLADPTKNPPRKSVPLREHASDLFQALEEFSADRAACQVEFFRFVWLRCHRKIKTRVTTDKLILGQSLVDLLRKWVPLDPNSDSLEERWFGVNSAFYEHFDSRGVPCRRHTGHLEREYLFSPATIIAWRNLFVSTLTILRDKVIGWEPSNSSIQSIDIINAAIWTWNSLLYDNEAFKALLAIPSLHSAIKLAEFTFREQQRFEQSATPLLLDEGDELGENVDFEDGSEDAILRYCQGIVAWFRAGHVLSRSKFFNSTSTTLNVLHVYKPSSVHIMTKPRDVMLSFILPTLTPSLNGDDITLIHQRLDADDFKTDEFTGAVHCEATLMAFMSFFFADRDSYTTYADAKISICACVDAD